MTHRAIRGPRWFRGRRRDESGVFVIFVVLLATMIGVAALMVDAGQLRASSRDGQLHVDLAALAGAKSLSQGDANRACRDAVTYLNMNDSRITPAINAASLCAPITNTCTNASTPAAGTVTAGAVTVSVRYPVPAAEITDPQWGGAGLNDGISQCRRLRVAQVTRDGALFSKIFGIASSLTSRSATVRPLDGSAGPPALWVLDPTGCVPLKVDGGSQVTVGTDTVKGIIAVDSDATTCTGGASTISSTGSGTLIQAIGPPTGTVVGEIRLNALSSGSGTCAIPACDPSDVTNGRIAPQPVHGDAATRAHVDWRYNCKSGYPTYHGTTINNCPDTPATGGTAYPYLDNLKTATGSSNLPASGTWITIGPNPNQCNPAATITYPVGNYYVKCAKGNNGFVVNSGVTVTFSGGNLVFEDNVTVSNGGTLNINTANANAHLPPSCLPPTVQTPCIANSSANAATVYLRGDTSTMLSTSGSGTINANHVFVYGGTGAIAASGNPPFWTAPVEGPFSGLAYWSDMPPTASAGLRSSYTVTGGSGATLTGTFFTPEASPFKLTGGGNWGQQHAQFISYQLTVTGNANLTISPDPNAIAPPPPNGYLIR